jgi:hypothetical protein
MGETTRKRLVPAWYGAQMSYATVLGRYTGLVSRLAEGIFQPSSGFFE